MKEIRRVWIDGREVDLSPTALASIESAAKHAKKEADRKRSER